MTGDDELSYEAQGPLARITLNRAAHRNTITGAMVDRFLACLDRAEEDRAARVVLVTAEGERHFCTGAELASGPASLGEGGDPFRRYGALLARLAHFPKPTVARIQGACVAGGTGFALACDIVIASETARFGTPEVNVGLFPMMVGALIFRNVRRKRAMEMMLLGQLLDAREALEIGLVTRVVAPHLLDDEVAGVVEQLAGKSPLGLRMGKQALLAAEGLPLGDAMALLADKLEEVASTADALEGITAFIERRKPRFTGH